MIKKIKIKTLFINIVIIEITLMILLVYFSSALSRTKEKLNKFETDRFYINQTADAIIHVSDELSNLAKSYVITKDNLYKKIYYNTLDIQKSNSIEPEYYKIIYWNYSNLFYPNLLIASPMLSLENLMNQIDYSSIERSKLNLIDKKFNMIINLELKAISLIDKGFKDNNNEVEKMNKHAQQLAIDMLYSTKYSMMKKEIIKSIDEVIYRLNTKSNLDIDKFKQVYKRYLYHFQTVIFLFIIVNLFSLYVLHKRVINIIYYITNEIKKYRKDKKDDMIIKSIYTDELGVLIEEFNYLQSIIKSKAKSLEKTNNILFEQHKMINKYVILSETDIKGKITYASEAFCKISGYSIEEIIGKKHDVLENKFIDEKTYKKLRATLNSNKTWKGQIKNISKKGKIYWTDSTIEPMYDQFGNKTGYRSIKIDITDRKILERVSVKDKLTNLYNRVKLDKIFEYEIVQSKRYKVSFVVIMIDIDKFKLVNDTYGHQAGDRVLKGFSNLLKENIRLTDTVGRWGGEEFLILCPKTNINKGEKLAEKLRKIFEKHDYKGIGVKTASFGVSEYIPGDTKEKMLDRADKALYKAKNTGRNKVVVYTEKE